jgi:glycosyltransferase involved in cell wall biosynthesis
MNCVTVAICTWNRAKLLDQTLTQMQAVRIPANLEWEVLVVNNNCTDDTDAVIARHQGALPLRCLFEPRQGQSNARNCAVAAARGGLLIWTDDDVLVEPEWLTAYHEAAEKWPQAGYFGGPIEPWYECSPPRWLSENVEHLAGMLLIKDLGHSERLLSRTEVPFGANMAFRTEILRENRFDPRLGLTGDDNIRNDESMLLNSLISQGVQGVWVPRARVKHFVTRQRLSREYLWDYFHGFGRSCARQDLLEHVPRAGKTWGGVPRWLIRQAVTSWVLAHWKQLFLRTDWVADYACAAFSVGSIAEILNQTRVGREAGIHRRGHRTRTSRA